MATRIQNRRGTAAAWAAQNPVLADGELGFETDTKIVKLGDGVTAWNDLTSSYLPLGGGTMTGVLNMGGNSITNLGAFTSALNLGNFAPTNVGDWSEDLNMGGNKVTNGATPTANSDLTTKSYVDGDRKIVGLGQSTSTFAITADTGGASLASVASVSLVAGQKYYFSGHARLWNSSGSDQVAYVWIEIDGETVGANNALIASVLNASTIAQTIQVERLEWTAPTTKTATLDLRAYRKVGGTSLSVQASSANPSEVLARAIPDPLAT